MVDSTKEGLLTPVHRQEIVAELGQQALETDDIDQLMHDASVIVAEALDADYCKILELLPGGDEVLLRQGVGWREGIVGSATVPTHLDSQAGYTLLTEEPVIVDDLRTEDRFSGPELLTSHDVVSGISVIIGSVEEPWGVLGTHSTDRSEFTEDDAIFVKNVANVLGSAIETKQAKRQLEEERALKDQILETSPVGIAVIDAGGEIAFVNERAEEIIDRNREEIRQFSYDDPYWGLTDANGEQIAEGETPFEQVMETGERVYDAEVGIRSPEGQRIWLRVNGAPLDPVDDNGTRMGAIFTFTDVTEKRRLKAEFEEMLERVTDAFYALDEEFRFTYANERAEDLLQRPEEELLGERFWDIYPEAAEIDEVWDSFQAALNDQEPASYELYYPPLEFWMEANLYPSETGVSVYFRDVTERKERERELEQHHALTQAANDVIITIDESSTIQMVNPAIADVFGYDADELIGEPLTVLMPDKFENRHLKGIERYLETGERALDWEYIELPGLHADRSEIPLAISFSESEFEGERFFTGVIRDVTERKRYERELEASHERLEQFASAVSHDLKEPLATVASYLQLLERRYTDELDEEAEEFINFAVDSATRMREMIDSIVSEYARVDSRGEAFEPVELDEVLEAVLADLGPKIDEHDAEITADSLPCVEGDASQLQQLFQNLLDNAIKYSGEDPPRIDVSAARDEEMWVISVSDEGIGIDSDATEDVFEVFTRLHDDEAYPGTGIGLALCQRIVDRHGGEIWVESKPGEGSTFFFTLPLTGNRIG